MYKSQQSAPTHQIEQENASPSFVAPAKASVDSSNTARQEDTGTESGGVSESEMSLSGSFAAFILECMPFGDALQAAVRFASNPAVLDWAAQFTVADVANALQQPSDELLARIWPVGLGFDAETQVGGRLAGGVDVWARTSAMRAGADQLNLDVQYRGSMGVEGMGVGAQLTNAFGEATVAAIGKAGITLHAEVRAQQQSAFDLCSVIQSSKSLAEQSITDLLVHPLAPAQFLVPAEWVRRMEHMRMDDWQLDRTVTLEQGISNAVGQLDPEYHGSAVGERILSQPFSELVSGVLPMVQSGLFSRFQIRFEGLDTMVVEASLSFGASVAELLESTVPGSSMSPAGTDVVEDLIAMGSELALLWVIDLNRTDLSSAVDREKSGFRATNSIQVDGGKVIDGQFVTFSALESVSESTAEENPLLGRIDWSRSVELELNDDVLAQHCPPILQAVLGREGLLFDAEVDLRLVGQVALHAEASMDVLKEMFMGPDAPSGVDLHELFGVVVDLAFDPSARLPQWTSGWMAQLARLGALLEFSGARIVGHVHQGVGGGAEISLLASAEMMGRAEGGAMIDVPVEGSELNPLQMAIRGNASAA